MRVAISLLIALKQQLYGFELEKGSVKLFGKLRQR